MLLALSNRDSSCSNHIYVLYACVCAVQVAAILRGCYIPGQLPGLNHSLGCREWTNGGGFAALYCFCDTHLCNGAPSVKAANYQLVGALALLVALALHWSRNGRCFYVTCVSSSRMTSGHCLRTGMTS